MFYKKIKFSSLSTNKIHIIKNKNSKRKGTIFTILCIKVNIETITDQELEDKYEQERFFCLALFNLTERQDQHFQTFVSVP